MRRVTFLLRIWVIVGAALLLLQTPKGERGYAEYSPGSCISYGLSVPNCPSGCTGSDYIQYLQAPGNGVFYLKVYSYTPCGEAQPGETCNNPTQYTYVNDFSDCCAHLGTDCTGKGFGYLNCCDSNAWCIASKCCIPDTYSGCGTASDCCSGGPCTEGTCQGSDCIQQGDSGCGSQQPCCYGSTCFNGLCCPNSCPNPNCSNISGYCWGACGCPGNEACSDCYAACYAEMYEGCESACTQCNICCP
jgi:hypothetical protein